MTVTLRAAGQPRFQQGRYTSPGRELAPGISAGTSLLGARAADWVAENRASLKESCRLFLNLFCLTDVAWCIEKESDNKSALQHVLQCISFAFP